MIISLIVAMDEKRGIGKKNQLPWHLPSDLYRFKTLTMGHHLVMGRKTFETLRKPLPGRVMVIVTHQQNFSSEGCLVVHSLEEAIELAEHSQESEVFIIGGGEIFMQAIAMADKIYLTTVHTDAHAEVKFPKLNPNQWSSSDIEVLPQKGHDEYESDFRILVRKH